jgi:hypothetical protein
MNESAEENGERRGKLRNDGEFSGRNKLENAEMRGKHQLFSREKCQKI